jgi:diguanylate cyclase (GGDEF)-like protein/PAS domain S-box-containing protein
LVNSPLRILVIEDQQIDAELMSAELKAGGLVFDWRRVDTEEEFIEDLSSPPDLILADYYLPGYSALEALAHLRKQDLDIPFIIISGMIDEELALETIALGATDYLFKDNLERLRFAVERAMAEKELRERHRTLQRHFREEMEKYREFVEGTEDLVVQIDTEGRYLFVNRMAEKYFGLLPDQCIGLSAFGFVHPEDREATRRAFAEWVDRRLRHVSYSNRVLNRKGDVFYLSWTINLHYDEEGGLIHVKAIAQDNTEQERLQGRLQEALRTYESIVEASPAAIFAVSADGTIMAWNRSAERVFGWTTEEVIGRPNPIFPPEKLKEFQEIMRQTLAGQGVFQKEMVRRNRDGRDIDISLSTAPLRDEEGQVQGVMAIIFDITESKQAEEMLRRLTAIIEATTDFVGVVDAEGRIEYINPAGRRLIGLPDEGELVGLRFPDFHPAWAMELLTRKVISSAVKKGTWRGETALLTASGEEVPVSQVVIAHRRADGKLSHLSTIIRDISQQKRSEVELLRLNRTLRMISRCNETLVRAQSEQELVERILRILVESGYPLALVWLSGLDEEDFSPVIQPEWAREFFDRMKERACHVITNITRICRERFSREISLEDELLACGQCADCRHLSKTLKLRSAFVLCLGTKNVQLGCLTIFSSEEGFFTEEVQLLKELANDLGFGIGSLRTEIAHQQAQEILRLRNRAIEASINGIMISEAKPPEMPIIYANPAVEKITGYSIKEVLGCNPHLFVGSDHRQPGLIEIRTALEEGHAAKALVRNYRKDGRLFWNEFSVAPVRDPSGELTHFVSIINDVTERKSYEEELERRSNFDHLTGLANRNLLSDRIRQGIAHARRTGKKMAILLLDLDRFQIINDSLGHSIGNELLKRVAERLETEVRSQDTLARIGGDEFVILLQEIETMRGAVTALEKFRAVLARPFVIGSRHLRVTASIGFSFFPDDGRDEEILLRNADLAMYHAKSAGRDTFRVFAPEMDVRIIETMDLEADLRQALELGEFILHFQPKIDVVSGEIVGSEALVRWQHPRRGMVSPGAFISLAEETGLIESIGEWVLREACRRNKGFQDEGLSPITVAVNISARQFRNEGLADMIADVLHETGLEPRWLDLELTESMIMDHPEEAAAMMSRLKETGISLSLDDFGTGYSSLNYLRRFPVDTLKIDRSFIADVESDPGSASVANSIIDIAHNLGIEAVAEGVETVEQLDFLRRCGCDKFQGFLFSRPVPAEQFAELLREGRSKIG